MHGNSHVRFGVGGGVQFPALHHCSRCITCKMDILPSELNGYFSTLTGGRVPDISKRISIQSMRAAWAHIEENEIEIVG